MKIQKIRELEHQKITTENIRIDNIEHWNLKYQNIEQWNLEYRMLRN